MKYANIIVTVISLIFLVWGVIALNQSTKLPVSSIERRKKEQLGGSLIVTGSILISIGNLLAVWLRLETKTL